MEGCMKYIKSGNGMLHVVSSSYSFIGAMMAFVMQPSGILISFLYILTVLVPKIFHKITFRLRLLEFNVVFLCRIAGN